MTESKVDIEAAREALDSLDVYARMDVGVDAHGPRGMLERFIAQQAELIEALSFYAEKHHFMLANEDAWDTVSGEPQNYWCDEEGTATVEDGSIARAALAACTPAKSEASHDA